jgi:hypothetical protein
MPTSSVIASRMLSRTSGNESRMRDWRSFSSLGPNPGSFRGVRASLRQGLVVLQGDARPDHRPAEFVRSRLHPLALVGVFEQDAEGVGKSVDVAEFHEASAPIGEHLLGVPVGRRNDGGSGGEGIRQRAGHNLFLVVVRRDVDISRRQVLAEVLLGTYRLWKMTFF